MKLWFIGQWGNHEEGTDGKDTQCVIRGNDMMRVIKSAEECFQIYREYRGGRADFIFLLGEDGLDDDGKEALIIPVWIGYCFNLGNLPLWHRRYWDTDKWESTKTLYGVQFETDQPT